ncbi:MAG: hypothetical protein ABI395_09845 [Sphingobium sp.]
MGDGAGGSDPNACVDRITAYRGFGQQEHLPVPFRGFLFAWLRHFHVAPRTALAPVLQDLAERKSLRLEFTSLWRGYAWAAKLTRV